MKDIMGMMGKIKDMQSKMEKMQEELADLEELIEELETRLDEDIGYWLGDVSWRVDVLTDVLRSRTWGDELLDQHLGPQPGW